LATLYFPIGDLDFGKEELPDLLSTISSTATVFLFIELKLKFYLKLELEVSLVNVEDGEIVRRIFAFPVGNIWSFRIPQDVENFKKASRALLDQILNQPLESTKWHFYKLHQITLKIAKRQFGGCKHYKTTFPPKSSIQEVKMTYVSGDVWLWLCTKTYQESMRHQHRIRELNLLRLETDTMP